MSCILHLIVLLFICCVDFADIFHANGQPTAQEMENSRYTETIESMLANLYDQLELLQDASNQQDSRLSLLEEKSQPGS
jgi:hypothetical protein